MIGHVTQSTRLSINGIFLIKIASIIVIMLYWQLNDAVINEVSMEFIRGETRFFFFLNLKSHFFYLGFMLFSHDEILQMPQVLSAVVECAKTVVIQLFEQRWSQKTGIL